MPVTALIFTKFKTDQWYYLQIFYTIFHPNRSTTLNIKGRYSLRRFSRNALSSKTFCK